MAADETTRRASGWRHLGTFVLAHAVAVGAGSVTLAVTATVMALQDPAGLGNAAPNGFPMPMMVAGGLLFVTFFAVVGGSILALPASLVAYPLALLAVRRGRRGGGLLALGGGAGLVIGLPLLILVLSASDLPRLVAALPDAAWDAATAFGPAAMAAGMGFAWMVGRLSD